MRKSILLIAIFFLSACAGPRYTTTALKLPPTPVYEKVSSDELQCLSNDAYKRLAISIKQRNAHIITLENIIKSTQAE